MKDITKFGYWHKVKRVVAGPDDVSDRCSEMHPSNLKHNRQWLEAMVEAGHMTEKQKNMVLALHQADVETVSNTDKPNRQTKYEDYGQLTRCEKKLCMAVTSEEETKGDIRSVCRKAQKKDHKCDKWSTELLREKCKAKHWTSKCDKWSTERLREKCEAKHWTFKWINKHNTR